MTRILLLPALALSLTATTASADIFSFNDVDGFATCLQQDHLVETTNAGNGKQTRFIDKVSIQVRCIEVAEKRISTQKSSKVILDWVKVAQKYSNRVNSIDLLHVLAKADRKQCNEPVIYDTILDIFSAPRSDDKKSLFQRAKRVTMTCLADPVFKQDFSDELESTPGSYRYEAVCEVLKGAGVKKKCGKT